MQIPTTMKNNWRCAKTHKILHHRFRSLGRLVAKFPSWFIAVPIFVTMFLATGLQRLESKLDLKYFATIYNSEAIRNRDLIESLFPMDVSRDFNMGRFTRVGKFAMINIKAKNKGSLLRGDVAEEIIKLSNVINNVTIVSGSKTYRYEDLCLKSKGHCYINDVLSLYIERGSNYTFKYPIERDGNYGIKFYGAWMGGVELNEAGLATSVKATRLIYTLEEDDPQKSDYSDKWLLKLQDDVKYTDFKVIDVSSYASEAIEQEMASTPHRSIPYMIVASTLVITFTAATCIVPNWIKGKPWTGVTTAIGSCLASLSGFGLIGYFGAPFLYYNVLIPFLVLGVSMDDTFVFLSAWRRTDPDKSTEERLGEAYAESSVAITMTSVTNIVSFAIGAMMSPFPPATVFCTLTSLCLLFDFIYQITFVGACMAVLGRAEKANRHCFTMIPIQPLKNSEGPKGCVQKFLYHTGHHTEDLKDSSFLLTMWDTLGDTLTKTRTKVFVLISFGAYFSVALWGASTLTSKFESKDMAFYDSPTYQFLKETSELFHQYLERVQVVVPYTLDYSDPKVNKTLQQMFDAFESSDILCDSTMTESWLKSYHEFLSDPRFRALTSSYNTTDKRDFVLALRVFLRLPAAKRFAKDILFNDNRTEIIASRFFFQTNNTKDDSTFNTMWWDFQELAKSFSIPVVVFQRYSFIQEGFRVMKRITIQTLGVATCAVAAVSYLFLFSVRCTISVAICVLSIAIGVLGYMSIWGVSLNTISVTILMLLCGFSVDYSSHVICVYVSAPGASSDKVRKTLRAVGLPIFQASATTILAVLAFIIPPSFSFMVLFKIVILLSILASIHALIFLPVFISLLEDSFKHLTKTLKPKPDSGAIPREGHCHVNHGAELSKTEDVDSIQLNRGKAETSNTSSLTDH